MKFTKMHGCGNDYVYVNAYEETVADPSAVARFVSDRHFGIGADGLILIAPSEVADCRMVMYNADGSEGNMCGNGIRCVAKYVYDHGMTDQTRLSVETKSGVKQLELTVENGRVTFVTVDMGTPVLEAARIPVRAEGTRVIDEPITVDQTEYRMTCVSMGNPHAVVCVEDLAHFPIERVGPLFECHERFPDRINTEFVEPIGPDEIAMRVWERGSGETLACGTGACASVVSCVVNGLTGERVRVHLLGGDLEIHYDRANDTVWMRGPATTVYEGEITI